MKNEREGQNRGNRNPNQKAGWKKDWKVGLLARAGKPCLGRMGRKCRKTGGFVEVGTAGG